MPVAVPRALLADLAEQRAGVPRQGSWANLSTVAMTSAGVSR